MGFANLSQLKVDILYSESKEEMSSGANGFVMQPARRGTEAPVEPDGIHPESGDLIAVLRALRRLSAELRKINVSLTNQIYSLRETVHDYHQMVAEDFKTLEKRLRQGLLTELERIERELSRIRNRLDPVGWGTGVQDGSWLNMTARRSKSEPSSPRRSKVNAEKITERKSLPPSPHRKASDQNDNLEPPSCDNPSVILEAYCLTSKKPCDKPSRTDRADHQRSRSEERDRGPRAAKFSMERSRSAEVKYDEELLVDSPRCKAKFSPGSADSVSSVLNSVESRQDPTNRVSSQSGNIAESETPLYLLPYETVGELAAVIDRIVSSGLGIRLIVSAPPKAPISRRKTSSASENVKVAALSHRADFYHNYFEAHYGGNRQRSRVVREDLPKARQEQAREIEEALALRNLQEQVIRQQEDADAAVARRLAEELEREEGEQRRMTQLRDEQVAKRMQGLLIGQPVQPAASSSRQDDTEFLSHRRTLSGGSGHSQGPPPSRSRESTISGKQPRALPKQPSYQNGAAPLFDRCSPPPTRQSEVGNRGPGPQSGPSRHQQELVSFGHPSHAELDDEDRKYHQEERDAELAKLLQEVEHRRTLQRRSGQPGSSSDEQFDRDRLLAIEVQDRELARILQEKERARLKRAKERARLKSSSKESERDRHSQESTNAVSQGWDPTGASAKEPSRSRDAYTAEQGSHRLPRQDLNSIEPASPGTSNEPNIAMAIDPTYRSSTTSREREFPRSRPAALTSSTSTYSERRTDEDECEAPPYMPIAGQRRSLSLEKKKKHHRDGCKAQ